MPDRTPDAPHFSHKWEPIQDLPSDWRALCRADLHDVHEQWAADRKLIKDETKFKIFQEQLLTRWAIETGIIERLYTVDRGVTVQILEAGMEALGQFHARNMLSADARALITDQREAIEMVMDLVGNEERELTAFYIKELHQRLTLSQETCDAEDQFGNRIRVPLRKGEWKNQPNNPRRSDGSIHEYCPPEQVQGEIERLLAWHMDHDEQDVCAEVEAAWIHHRFTQIHPFQDGNGRIARALTGAVFLKAGYLVLVIRDEEHRERYLDALESADRGEFKPLVDLFADIQKSDLSEAIESIRSLRGEDTVKAVESVAAIARQRQDALAVRMAGVIDKMVQIVSVRLKEVAAEMLRAFESERVVISANVVTDDTDRSDWWSWQIIEAAHSHGYYADLERPRRWVSLKMGLPVGEERESRLVISWHAIGRTADLHAATAFLTSRLEEGWDNRVIPENPFRFGAETFSAEDEAGFRAWLDETVAAGVTAWGERL